MPCPPTNGTSATSTRPCRPGPALEVFAIDGGRDLDFLNRIFDKLLVNFTWWVNLQDSGGNNLFEGGFLGLDNIGPLDRSHLPVGGKLEQSDATGWMAFYALSMAAIATILNRSGERPAGDLVLKFLEHFAAIRRAMETSGVWDDAEGLYYDQLVTPDGTAVPVKVRSMVGIIPLFAAVVIDEQLLDRAQTMGKRFARLIDDLGGLKGLVDQGLVRGEPGERRLLLGVVGVDRLEKVLAKLFDEDEFLSPYGLRAVSAFHREHPYELVVEGLRASIDYEPAESTTSMFGGNSNWRGPIWFPLNYLLISALDRYARFFGDDLRFDFPTGGRHPSQPERDRRRPPRPAGRAVPPRTGRAPALLRRRGPAAARRGVEGQPGLQRVLPRRQRRRPRRVAPDGMDRHHRRRDPGSPWRRGVLGRRPPASPQSAAKDLKRTNTEPSNVTPTTGTPRSATSAPNRLSGGPLPDRAPRARHS